MNDILYSIVRLSPDQPFAIPSVLFIILSLPLVFRLIPRNGWYGFRTKRTLEDDAAWYDVNNFLGRALIKSGLIYITVALLTPYRAQEHDFDAWLTHLAAFGVPVALSFIATYFHAKKA